MAQPSNQSRVKPDIHSPLVAILGAPFETGNHGVSALASGTISAIRQGLPDARILMLDYGREPATWTEHTAAGSVQVELLNLRFSKKLLLPNNVARLIFLAALIRLIPVKSWRRSLVSRSRYLRQVAEIDINLSINGGDSFSDIYGMGRLAYVVLPQLLVLLLERPLIQLPQTHGPFKSRLARFTARYLLHRSKIAYSRDKEGLRVIQELLGGPAPHARFAFDMGFALEPLPPATDIQEQVRGLKARGPLIGFNPSGLLVAGGYTKNNMFGLKTDYAQLVECVLASLLSEPNTQVLLVPHVFGPEENAESDVSACKKLLAKYGGTYPDRLHYLPRYFDHHETKYIIGQCEFFLGSRMHACIGALSQCVPAIGLAYSRKFAGVMELVGDGAVVIDLRSAELEEASRAVQLAWSKRQPMRQSLLECMPALRRSVLGLCEQPEIQSLRPQPIVS